jgi:hypothetical protein
MHVKAESEKFTEERERQQKKAASACHKVKVNHKREVDLRYESRSVELIQANRARAS